MDAIIVRNSVGNAPPAGLNLGGSLEKAIMHPEVPHSAVCQNRGSTDLGG